MKELINSPW